MRKKCVALALAGCALVPTVHAISTNDIQLWAGSGTNRAALVIEWNSPEVFNNSTVPAPVANKSLVWGYQFNGTATAAEMFTAILASDHRLYAVISSTFGTYVEAIGYNLDASGNFGVTDGSQTFSSGVFTKGALIDANLNVDASRPIDTGDLYWGGYFGPNWNVWNEIGDAGSFGASPNRGTNQFWNTDTGIQGQWEFASFGLDELPVYDGSWIGFSVAAAGYDTNTADPATAAFNLHEQAPPSPDGTYVAYIPNTNDFAVQVISSSSLSSSSPYGDANAVLGRPSLTFFDIFDGAITNRSSLIDPPYNVAPDGSDLIAKIDDGGQITVMMGRKVYHDSRNPYGADLMVFGNSFFSAANATDTISDLTDLDITTLSSGAYGHAAIVSVSPDNTNWYTFPTTASIFPANAYRWDEPNHSWSAEQLNPNKPLDPSVYSTDFGGQTAASALDQFSGSAGGTAYNLESSGFPWIQYVRLEPDSNSYAVIDAIAAVNPLVEGDALTITPDDRGAGMTNLVFQAPGNTSQTLVSLNFHSVSNVVKISAVGLSEFSAFAPVPGRVLNACKVSAAAAVPAGSASLLADIGLGVVGSYAGNGGDLRVLQWNGAGWTSPAFVFDSASEMAWVNGVTNLSAFVVAQIAPPPLSAQFGTNGLSVPLTPFANVTYALQRSTDLLTWVPVTTVKPADTSPLTLQDPSPPAGQAFYRLMLHQ